MTTTQQSGTQVPTSRPAPASADAELKAKHRTMWGLGNYASVASDVIAATGPALVEATGIGPDDRVLDIAAGSGNASFPAAATGAEVVASDLSPVLLDVGRAQDADGRITWEEADAEALPYDDASFDAVISCVGVMFAPHHQAAADELLRVSRPGAKIGLLSWTPEGFIGQMFATMKPYAPPPPPGAQPPPLWGSEDHVRELFGDRVEDVVATKRRLHVDRFARPASSASSSRRATARRSRSTRPTPRTPSAARPSTATSTPWPTGTAQPAARWSGSTSLLTARRR